MQTFKTPPEFHAFPKMARFSRDIITEKIDGTNAQVFITEDGDIFAGSRKRWITPEQDNFGFAKWVDDNKSSLLGLGPGRHFGEWWGSGVQRGYGLTKGEKKFSLFNVQRWHLANETPCKIACGDPRIEKYTEALPSCCDLVPVLYRGPFSEREIDAAINHLAFYGSSAAEGFMNPEGIIIFHVAGNVGFKKTIEKDELPKSLHQ